MRQQLAVGRAHIEWIGRASRSGSGSNAAVSIFSHRRSRSFIQFPTSALGMSWPRVCRSPNGTTRASSAGRYTGSDPSRAGRRRCGSFLNGTDKGAEVEWMRGRQGSCSNSIVKLSNYVGRRGQQYFWAACRISGWSRCLASGCSKDRQPRGLMNLDSPRGVSSLLRNILNLFVSFVV